MPTATSYPIDTTPLRRVVAMFVRLSLEIMEGALEGRSLSSRALSRAVRYSRDIARLSRQIGKTELANMRAMALARLASDPNWKAQVRLQLGGYWVIKAWGDRFRFQSARAAKLKASGESIPANAPISEIKAQAQTTAAPQSSRPDIRTDATGQFRLAPIPRLMSPREQAARHIIRARASRELSRAGRLSPTALTPDLIRIPKITSCPDLAQDWEWDRRAGRFVECAPSAAELRAPP